MQFKKICLAFLRMFSDDLKVTGSLFHILGAATEKARLIRLRLVLGTKSCEIDDLSCLVIFNRCRRQAK